MKTSITRVQLAILDAKRSRALELHRQLDGVCTEIEGLLELGEADFEGDTCIADHVIRFVWDGDMEPAKFVEYLGIEVRR